MLTFYQINKELALGLKSWRKLLPFIQHRPIFPHCTWHIGVIIRVSPALPLLPTKFHAYEWKLFCSSRGIFVLIDLPFLEHYKREHSSSLLPVLTSFLTMASQLFPLKGEANDPPLKSGQNLWPVLALRIDQKCVSVVNSGLKRPWTLPLSPWKPVPLPDKQACAGQLKNGRLKRTKEAVPGGVL